jgi:pilus assembly protein CpaE
MSETGVVLCLEDPALLEEVLDFLDRLPRVRVAAAVSAGPGLARHVRDHRPGAVVASPGVLSSTPDLDGTGLLVVSQTETTEALRTAIRAGATGFYLWPEDRASLGRDAERVARPSRGEPSSSGRVVAVHAPRGGSGSTFLATNLAAACAGRSAATVLVDLDPFSADVTTALGIRKDETVPTIADLVAVENEMTEEHVDRVLHQHGQGFRALLAPPDIGSPSPGPAGTSALIRLLRDRNDIVLLHLPRAVGEVAGAAIEFAEVVFLVVTLDVLGIRAASRTIDFLRGLGVAERCRLVLNRVSRGEIIPSDAERVLGVPVAAAIRADRAVPAAQNRGELVAGRGTPSARQVAALARTLIEERAE